MKFTRQLAILVIVSALTQAVSAQPHVTSEARYPFKAAGVLGRSGNERDINWLDDQRILFVGFKQGEKRREKDGEFVKFNVYVWNTASGDVRQHAELSSLGSVCVSNGYVRFQFDRDGRRFVRSGTFGSEREVELDIDATKNGSLAVNPVSCVEYNPKLLDKRYGARALPLLEAGEYLDRGLRDVPGSMRYFSAAGRAPIPLSIPPRRANTVPQYSEYARKYVFNEIRSNHSPDNPATVWLLDRLGSVDEVTLPAGLWMAAVVRALPAQGGWVMTSKAGRAGAAGVYHISKGAAVRVMRGIPEAFAVSPSGCKVAVVIDSELQYDGLQLAVRMIDFCSKRS